MQEKSEKFFFTQTSDDCFIIDSVTVGLNIFYSILKNLWEALDVSVSAIIESLFEKKVWML